MGTMMLMVRSLNRSQLARSVAVLVALQLRSGTEMATFLTLLHVSVCSRFEAQKKLMVTYNGCDGLMHAQGSAALLLLAALLD